MNVILCGYHWSGCKAADFLFKEGHNLFVYTHENEFYIPSLIDYCNKNNIRCTTDKITQKNLPFQPDVICSVYYRYIISKEVIEGVNGKIFNLHPSLLPKYKGCSSVTWAIINQENNLGYTWHYLTPEVDGGNILIQKVLELSEFDIQVSAYYRVMFEAMKDFMQVLELVLSGYSGTLQEKTDESYFPRKVPHQGVIDEDWNDDQIKAFIRALIFPPLPLAKYKNTEIHSFQEFQEIKKKG